MGARKDRISLLPDGLLHNILSRVPIQTAVSSSTLSKRWRHLWKTLPDLDLNEDLWKYLIDKRPLRQDRLKLVARDYATVVDWIMRQHNGPVLRTLQIRMAEGRKHRSLLKKFVGTASEKQVEELCVRFQGNLQLEIPQFILRCDSLTSLRLCYGLMTSSLRFRGLPNLRRLYLKWAIIGDHQLPTMLEECPQLESIDLERCAVLYDIKIITQNPAFKSFTATKCSPLVDGIEIDAPYLRSLRYSGREVNFSLKNISMLRDALINIPRKTENQETMTMFISPSNIEVLTIHAYALKELLRESCEDEDELDAVRFPNLREIQLLMDDVCASDIVALSWLMSISPSVDRVFLRTASDSEETAAESLRQPPILELFDIATTHPMYLVPYGFTGLPYERLMLRYFLTKAQAPVNLLPRVPHGFWRDHGVQEITEVDDDCRGQISQQSREHFTELLEQLPETYGELRVETQEDNEGIENILPMHRDF